MNGINRFSSRPQPKDKNAFMLAITHEYFTTMESPRADTENTYY